MRLFTFIHSFEMYYTFVRSVELKAGYTAELAAREKEINDVKLELETLYMSKLTDKEILEDLDQKNKFESVISQADAGFNNFAGTMKSVKMAIVTWFKKQHLDWQ